jgi:hypothetical protein
MKAIYWFILPALFLGVLFTACKKEESTNDDLQSEQMVASLDQTTANDLYEDIDAQVDNAIETRGGGDPTACPVITISPVNGSYPRTMTIDYGTEGCPGPNGRIRKGQIVVTLSDTIIQQGATRTVTFVDFYVDDAHVEGVRTWTNEGFDGNGNITIHRQVTGGKITFPNADVVTWNADHTMTQVQGGSTPFILLDNVFEVTGGSNGINRHGKAFTVEITQPLVKKHGCPWFVSGEKTLTVLEKVAMIDYGSGDCDNKAIVTLPNGTQKEIQVKKWW